MRVNPWSSRQTSSLCHQCMKGSEWVSVTHPVLSNHEELLYKNQSIYHLPSLVVSDSACTKESISSAIGNHSKHSIVVVKDIIAYSCHLNPDKPESRIT